MTPADTTAAEHAPAATAATSDERRPEDAISLSYGVVTYLASFYGFNYGTVSLSDQLWLAPGIELAAGLRAGFGAHLSSGACFEGFGSISVAPHFRTASDSAGRTASWRPVLGIEVGETTASLSAPTIAPGSIIAGSPSASGIYGAIAARPIRFRLSGFQANILGLTFGSMLSGPGRVLRLQLDLVQVGVVL